MADDLFRCGAEFGLGGKQSVCRTKVGNTAGGRDTCSTEEYDVVAIFDHLPKGLDLIIHGRHFFRNEIGVISLLAV